VRKAGGEFGEPEEGSMGRHGVPEDGSEGDRQLSDLNEVELAEMLKEQGGRHSTDEEE
jgi:hypothetical protein